VSINGAPLASFQKLPKAKSPQDTTDECTATLHQQDSSNFILSTKATTAYYIIPARKARLQLLSVWLTIKSAPGQLITN